MNPQMMIAITGKNMTKPAFDSVVGDANRAANAVTATGGRMGAAMGGASFQTANLAAQFNDIGVMLASGQSPFILALQQGTQISQVLGPMGAAGAVNALKTAFISLFNPISLITIGTIAAGAALFQYFTSLNTDGKASTEVIKDQNDLLASVAQNWGDAVPALKAYVDELDRASKVSDLNTATDIGVQRQFEALQASLGDWRVELAAARIDIQAFGGDAQEIDALQHAFENLDDKVRDGTASTADLDAVLAALAGTTGSQSIPSLVGFAGVLQQVSGLLAAAAANAATLRSERDALMMAGPDASVFYDQQDFVAEQERINSLTAEQVAIEREVSRVKNEAKGEDVVVTEAQALDLAQQRLNAEERRSKIAAASKSGASAVSDLDRERQAVTDLIAELEYEQSLIGMTNVEKEIQNALRRAGAAATEDERRQIAELISVTEEHEAAQKQLTDAWNEYGNIGKTAVRGVKDALKDGKIEANEFSDILGKIGDSFLDLALNGLFNSFGGGGKKSGGGFLGGIFGFSEGGGGVVGGAGSYVPGGADDTLFVAKAQKGEPFAFGAAAVTGLGGGSGGTSVVRIELGEGLVGQILQQANGAAIEIAGATVKPVATAVNRMSKRARFGG